MKINVFSYTTYLEIVNEVISQNNQRGFKSKLASAAGCQLSFLSQALSGVVNLTEDHLFGIANYLRFTDDEKDFFLLLLRREKSSSKLLRFHIEDKINYFKKTQKNLSKRIEVKEDERRQNEKYYSAWYYSAIHVALSIPKISSIEKLEKLLGLRRSVVKSVIQSLCEMNLVKPSRRFFEAVEYNLHVKSESPLFRNFNIVWRNYLLFRLQDTHDDNLHYTAVHSVSLIDYNKIREKVIELIQDSRHLVESSAEEELISVAIDLVRF